MQNSAQAGQLREQMSHTFLTSVAARLLDQRLGGKLREETAICAMFRNLGRLLATFYFFDEMKEINQLIAEKDISEEQAAREVLGLALDELGVGIARE